MNPDEVLKIAKRQGYFFVSPKWRHTRLRKICHRMCKRGLLKEEHWKKHGRYGYWFMPTKEALEE